MTSRAPAPFSAPEPDSVPLASSPLVSAVFQMAFRPVEALRDFAAAAAVHETLRGAYPMFARGETRTVTVTPEGPVMNASPVWNMQDADGNWTLTVGPEIFNLFTRSYASRADFMARAEAALEALEKHAAPKEVVRFGVRYVNRMQAGSGQAAASVFAEGLAGSGWMSAATDAAAMHSQSVLSGSLPGGGGMVLRWGLLPAGTSHDPGMMPPAGWNSCYVDVDAALEVPQSPVPFSVGRSMDEARRLAGRCYAGFRWTVSDLFLAEAQRPPVAFQQPGVWTAGAGRLH